MFLGRSTAEKDSILTYQRPCISSLKINDSNTMQYFHVMEMSYHEYSIFHPATRFNLTSSTFSMALDVVLIITALIFAIVVIIASVYFVVYFQHPTDKWTAWFPKAVVVEFFLL